MKQDKRGTPYKFTGGYLAIYCPDHPKASQGRVYAHVIVAERALGKYLPPGAEVHHVNEDRADNNPGNLVICQDKAYHKLLHLRARAFLATGNPRARACRFCKGWGLPGTGGMTATRNQSYGHVSPSAQHLACKRAYRLAWKEKHGGE